MAKFTKAITDSGIALLSSLLEGEKITFTKAVLSETPISNLNTPPTLIENAVGTNIKCVLDSLNPNKVLLEARVPSHAIKANFNFSSYAIYAKKESSQEVIFYCATTASPDTLTSQDAMEQSLVIGVDIELSREANVTVNVNNDLVWVTFSDLEAHTGNKNNPHAVTKEQVGLGKVENYAISHNLIEDKESYASSFVVYKLSEYLGQALQLHTESKHIWTKEDIGLGEVQNYGKATVGDTESDSSYSTPMTVQHQIETSLKPLDEKIINIIRKDSLKVDDTMTLVSDLEGNLTLGVKPKKTGFKDLEGSPNENESLKQLMASKLQATDIITNGNITMSRNGNQITLSVNVPNIPQGSDINAEVIKILAQKIDIDKVADVIRSMSSALLVTKQGNLAQLTLDLSKDQNITQINTQLQSLKKQIEAIKPNTGGGSSGESGGGNKPSIDLEALDKRYIQPLVPPLNAEGNPYWYRKEGEQIVPLNLIQVTAELDKITDNHTQEITTLKKSVSDGKANVAGAITAKHPQTTATETSTFLELANAILDIPSGEAEGSKGHYFETVGPLKEYVPTSYKPLHILNLYIALDIATGELKAHRIEEDNRLTKLTINHDLTVQFPLKHYTASKDYLVYRDKADKVFTYALLGTEYTKVESNIGELAGSSNFKLSHDSTLLLISAGSNATTHIRTANTCNYTTIPTPGYPTQLTANYGPTAYVASNGTYYYNGSEWIALGGLSKGGKYWSCNASTLYLTNATTKEYVEVPTLLNAFQADDDTLIACFPDRVDRYTLNTTGHVLEKSFKVSIYPRYADVLTSASRTKLITTKDNKLGYLELDEETSTVKPSLASLEFPIWLKALDNSCLFTYNAEDAQELITTVTLTVMSNLLAETPTIKTFSLSTSDEIFPSSLPRMTNGMLHLQCTHDGVKKWWHIRLSDMRWFSQSTDGGSANPICANPDGSLLKGRSKIYYQDEASSSYIVCPTQPDNYAFNLYDMTLKTFRYNHDVYKYNAQTKGYDKAPIPAPSGVYAGNFSLQHVTLDGDLYIVDFDLMKYVKTNPLPTYLLRNGVSVMQKGDIPIFINYTSPLSFIAWYEGEIFNYATCHAEIKSNLNPFITKHTLCSGSYLEVGVSPIFKLK